MTNDAQSQQQWAPRGGRAGDAGARDVTSLPDDTDVPSDTLVSADTAVPADTLETAATARGALLDSVDVPLGSTDMPLGSVDTPDDGADAPAGTAQWADAEAQEDDTLIRVLVSDAPLVAAASDDGEADLEDTDQTSRGVLRRQRTVVSDVQDNTQPRHGVAQYARSSGVAFLQQQQQQHEFDMRSIPPRPPLPASAAGAAAPGRRNRMPVWGWAAIAVAGLGLLGGGAAGVASLAHLADHDDEAPASAESTPPTASEIAPEPATGDYALADDTPAGVAPVWLWTPPAGWSATASSGAGWNDFAYTALAGCQISFYNGPFIGTGDDATDTAMLHDAVIGRYTDGVGDAKPVGNEPYWISAGDQARFEFLRSSFDITGSGSAETVRLAVRTRVFSANGTALSVAYRCATSAPSAVAAKSVNSTELGIAPD